MTKLENSMLLEHIVKDERYKNQTVHELKVIRANMIETGTATTYDLACLQYWLMQKEGRLPWANK